MINPSKAKTFNKVIFAAMARENFCVREHIVKFILEHKHTPTSAFMMYSYFLLDTVDRKSLITANNELIKRSDELWVFGIVSNGVEEEIKISKKQNMPVKYFNCTPPDINLVEIPEKEVKYKKY